MLVNNLSLQQIDAINAIDEDNEIIACADIGRCVSLLEEKHRLY